MRTVFRWGKPKCDFLDLESWLVLKLAASEHNRGVDIFLEGASYENLARVFVLPQLNNCAVDGDVEIWNEQPESYRLNSGRWSIDNIGQHPRGVLRRCHSHHIR